MRSTHARFAVLALMFLSSTAAAQARRTTSQAASGQQGYWELGADAALVIGLEKPRSLALRIPNPAVRAGYFTTPTVSIEPMFSWFSMAQENRTGSSSYSIGAGVLLHQGADRNVSRFYIRPFLGVNGGNGGSDIFVGGGFGLKKPLFGGRAAARGEANVTYDDAGTGTLYLNGLFGLSIYNR